MIKIRYADLPQGLHADVHTGGRKPVIYLLPGLSPAQRRDALRRLIRTSRRGYGPRLRPAGVGFAVARDIAKSTVRNGLAAVRCHPAGSVVLAALVTAAVVCYALFVTVTVRFSPPPAGPPGAPAAAPSGSRDAGGLGRSPGGEARAPAATQPAASVKPEASPAASAAGEDSGPSGSAPAGSGSGSSVSGSSGSGSSGSGLGRSGRPASPEPLPTGTWSAPGGVLPSASARPSPTSAPRRAGSAPQRGSPGGLCLQVGPLGICISG